MWRKPVESVSGAQTEWITPVIQTPSFLAYAARFANQVQDPWSPEPSVRVLGDDEMGCEWVREAETRFPAQLGLPPILPSSHPGLSLPGPSGPEVLWPCPEDWVLSPDPGVPRPPGRLRLHPTLPHRLLRMCD